MLFNLQPAGEERGVGSASPPQPLPPRPAAVPEHGAAAPQPPPARRHLGPPGAREVTSPRTPAERGGVGGAERGARAERVQGRAGP